MRIFALWLAIALGVLGPMGGIAHWRLSADPQRIAVVLDSSYEMQGVWHSVPALLDAIDDRRYAQFSLLTDKSRMHGWSKALNLGGLRAYAPRDFTKLSRGGSYPEIEQADRVYLLTNAPEAETAAFGGWTIVRPRP